MQRAATSPRDETRVDDIAPRVGGRALQKAADETRLQSGVPSPPRSRRGAAQWPSSRSSPPTRDARRVAADASRRLRQARARRRGRRAPAAFRGARPRAHAKRQVGVRDGRPRRCPRAAVRGAQLPARRERGAAACVCACASREAERCAVLLAAQPAVHEGVRAERSTAGRLLRVPNARANLCARRGAPGTSFACSMAAANDEDAAAEAAVAEGAAADGSDAANRSFWGAASHTCNELPAVSRPDRDGGPRRRIAAHGTWLDRHQLPFPVGLRTCSHTLALRLHRRDITHRRPVCLESRGTCTAAARGLLNHPLANLDPDSNSAMGSSASGGRRSRRTRRAARPRRRAGLARRTRRARPPRRRASAPSISASSIAPGGPPSCPPRADAA